MNVFRQIRRLLRCDRVASRPIARATCSDTAGIIIIGDEILRGDIADANVRHLCCSLRDVGISVDKVSIIPDNVDVIANEVKQFSSAYRYVFTSGGVGPTHDDLTYEGVAKALGEGVYVDSGIMEAFETLYGRRSDSGPLAKFATVPVSSKILYGQIKLPGRTLRLPLVRARNIYIFPGVPKALVALFPLFVEDEKRVQHKGPEMEEVFLKADEVSITPLLNDTVEKFKGRIKIGSYPQLDNNYCRVRLSLEARNAADIGEVKSYLLGNLPSDSLAQFDRKPLENAWEKLQAFAGGEPHVAAAVEVVQKAIETFALPGISIGFSGGKDCTVLLHIFYAINCDLCVVQGPDYKTAMQKYMERESTVKAFLLGNRSTDPASGELQHLSPTDPGWPEATRVFPLLHFSKIRHWKDKAGSSFSCTPTSGDPPLTQL